jgi:hypothetical protein
MMTGDDMETIVARIREYFPWSGSQARSNITVKWSKRILFVVNNLLEDYTFADPQLKTNTDTHLQHREIKKKYHEKIRSSGLLTFC